MKDHYDFGKAKRGPIVPLSPGKTRITIQIDDDVLEWFRAQVGAAEGRKSYQSMINQALREYMMQQQEPLELVLRPVVREELANCTVNQTSERSSDDQSE